MGTRGFFDCLKNGGQSRGSISITLLIMCLFLTLAAQLALFISGREWEHTLKYFQNRQLRNLCYSAMKAANPEDFAPGHGNLAEVVLNPGGKRARLSYISKYSGDYFLHYLEMEAALLQDKYAVQRLHTCSFTVPDALVSLASHYPLVYKTNLEGKEYLSGTGIYTSSEEVAVPQISFLKGIGIKLVNDEEISKQGLNRRFYFIDSDNTVRRFNFTGGRRFYGSTVFTSSGSISIGNGCSFPDKIVFVSERGSIDIGSNVQLDSAIIIAKNKVRIGAGCRIRGVIYADSIAIEGTSQFQTDENFVAHFSSGYFIS